MPDNVTLSTGEVVRTLEDGSSVHHPISIQAYVTSVGTPDVISIPTAAALADNTSNPTTVLYGTCLLAYDGSTWDRVRGDSTDGLLVNLGSNNDVVCTNSGTFAVQAAQSGTWNITNVSGTVSLPTGASTAAKQPALGTAGTASADVITVQGIASMTALKVDGSAVTQPVSGTVAATQSGAWDITNVSGTVSLPTGAATSAKQDSQTTLLGTIDADTGNISTKIDTIAGAVSGTEVQVDVVSSALPTGAATEARQPSLGTAGTPSGNVITVQGIAGMTAFAVTQSGTWDEVGINDSGNSITVDAPVGTPVFVRLSDGASAISTLPVSLASVPSHAVTNAGTFAVQAAQSGTWTVDLGATDNAVLDTIASPVATISATPLQRVAIFDAADAQITSFGGGTEYTEDAAAAANPVGKAMILVRADALAGVTTTDGDNVAARGTDKGEVYVKHADSVAVTSATLATEAKQDTIIGHVDGIETLLGTIDADTSTLAGAVSGAEMQVDVVTSALPSGAATSAKQDTIIGHVDGIEGLLTTIDADTGSILTAVQTIDNPVVVDDAAFTPASTSVMMAGFVFDDVSPDSVNEGDAGAGRMSSRREQYVQIRDAAGNERGLNIDASGKINVDSVTSITTLGTCTTVTTVSALTGGGVAHDGIDSGAPVKIGLKAIAHGTNPTAVAAADRTDLYANRAGIPFVIGGHPNIVTRTATVLDSDGAQTNVSLLSVSAGTKIVVTRVSIAADGSNTGPVNMKVGFGTATLAAASTTGTAGILADFLGVPPGGGAVIGDGSGIIGVGADDEDVRYTAEDPAGGAITVSISYFTIES